MSCVAGISALNGVPVRELPAGEMMASATDYLLGLDLRYRIGGRGPFEYDGFGFVRQAVQMVFDARCFRAGRKTRALLDKPFAGYMTRIPPGGMTPADALPIEPDAIDVVAMLEDAGMERLEGRGGASTQAGDVVVYIGPGPHAGVVMRGASDDPGEAIALAWNDGPRVRDDRAIGRYRVQVYRWPALEAVS
jgi:hypothetical protein